MFKQRRSHIVASIAAGMLAATLTPAGAGAQDINPIGAPSGNFTRVGLAWYLDVGQSFIAGGSYMNSFSFWFKQSLTAYGDPFSGVELVPYVAVWDGSKVVGSALFEGESVLITGSSAFERYDFATGDLALTPGSMYIAFVQVVNDPDHTGTLNVARAGFQGGAAATNFFGSEVKPLTDQWTLTSTETTLAFAADFSDTVTATPEPATLMLVGTGLAGMFGARKARRKREQ